MLFKIYGERNSGTNFLTSILTKNNFDCGFGKHYTDYDLPIIWKNEFSYWKHGIPNTNLKILGYKKVIDIFIFRNLEEWLISMHVNNYHLVKIEDFGEFLINKQQNDINDLDDNDKTIFEIRYYKIQKIIEYYKNNENVIFVNLSFLEDQNNLLYFLQKLNEKYMNNSLDNNFITKINHTKTGEEIKKRNYNIDLQKYQNIVNTYKNEEIEMFINNMTFDIK
jgi:hypothetical protein